MGQLEWSRGSPENLVQSAPPNAHDLRGKLLEKNGALGMMREDEEHDCCRDT